MDKTARKPSADPLQEKLRQNKANWNKEVSAFVNDLIHLKKMMNGWPSKFYKERSRIVDPIPADPATIIGSLAGDFAEIVNRGNALVQEQINYSKNRRQKQPKQLNLPNVPLTPQKAPEPEAPKPDLSKQLSLGLNADDGFHNYDLIAEASNPLTRFFARLLNPAIGESEAARVKRYRMSLLNGAAKIYKSLNKLQAEIVKTDPTSLWVANDMLFAIEREWLLIKAGIDTFIKVKPKGVPDAGGQISPPPDTTEGGAPASASPGAQALIDPEVAKAIAAVQDFKANADNFTGVVPKALRTLVLNFEKADPLKKKEMAANLLAHYNSLVATLAFKRGVPGAASLADVLAPKPPVQAPIVPATPAPASTPTPAPAQEMVETASVELERVAQGFVSKWWGKAKHLSPTSSDPTSAVRIDVYNNTKKVRKLLDEMMDSLEKGMDARALASYEIHISSLIDEMKDHMAGLTGTAPGIGYQPQFTQMMESGLLGRPIKLDPKQKANLDRMLRQKQLREITRMFGRR